MEPDHPDFLNVPIHYLLYPNIFHGRPPILLDPIYDTLLRRNIRAWWLGKNVENGNPKFQVEQKFRRLSNKAEKNRIKVYTFLLCCKRTRYFCKNISRFIAEKMLPVNTFLFDDEPPPLEPFF